MYYSVNLYLSHHGILGQKWGIRRYQNKDGSLTAEGRNRYQSVKQKAIDANDGKERRVGNLPDNWYEDERQYAGIVSVDKDTDMIPKGAVFQRIATYGEPVDDKRKYVSILNEDKRNYRDNADALPVGDPDKVAKIDLECKKPIKVATLSKTQKELQNFIGEDEVNKYQTDIALSFGQKKAKQILNEYGSKKISELDFDISLLNELTDNDSKAFTNKELKKNKWIADYLNVSTTIITRAHNKIASGKDEERSYAFYNHMKKLGYDAFVDPFDASDGYTDYPVVLLNPKDTVKKTGETYLYEEQGNNDD